MAHPSTRQLPVTVRVFSQRFSSTPLGARLARHLAVHRLDDWGIPYGCGLSDAVGLIVSELATNAITHGRVSGWDFELRLGLDAHSLFVDVSDLRGGHRPPEPGRVPVPPPDADGGRGLPLVEALADRWEVLDRAPAGKTVRAQLTLPR